MRLNLGASTDLRGPGWLNVDLVKPAYCTSGVGDAEFMTADLSLPWPWPDSSVDEIYAADIFEHIGDCLHGYAENCTRCSDGDPRGNETTRHWSGRIHVMNESWRVLKPGGILRMECPDAAKGAGAFQDPQHVSYWTPNALQYYADGSPAHKRFAEAYGITARFKVLGVTERRYEEWVGNSSLTSFVTCEVWKFAAVLEAVK